MDFHIVTRAPSREVSSHGSTENDKMLFYGFVEEKIYIQISLLCTCTIKIWIGVPVNRQSQNVFCHTTEEVK